MAGPPSRHILSVDVEDYFQVSAFENTVSREQWDQWPSRVCDNTRRSLDLIESHGATATFFIVGWVARKFPALVREIHARGHEVACHSYWHRLVYSLSPEEFLEDTRMARTAIEDAAGARVTGYRAPSWSITASSLWALDILREEGFAYDSSIFPVHHDRYGIPGAERHPHARNGLREYPPATLSMLGQNLPVAGGGYLRLLPMALTRQAFRQYEREGRQLVVYFHPWEIDPDQPRMNGSLVSRLRHYTNLGKMEMRLEELLSRYRFESFARHQAQ
jgi:polysaccharide deacetylase family protein (PEP-CTERM system associated)